MMNFAKAISIFLLVSVAVLACPMCNSSSTGNKDINLTYVIIGFIFLCYIPMYYIFKTVIRHKKINEIETQS